MTIPLCTSNFTLKQRPQRIFSTISSCNTSVLRAHVAFTLHLYYLTKTHITELFSLQAIAFYLIRSTTDFGIAFVQNDGFSTLARFPFCVNTYRSRLMKA